MNERDALPMVDFVGVGINSLDTLIRLPRFPAFDSKVEVISSEILPGGQVATAAVACQRWGLKTRYVGKVGDDLAGRIQRERIATRGSRDPPHRGGQIARAKSRSFWWTNLPGADDLMEARLQARPVAERAARRSGLHARDCCTSMVTPAHPAALAARWAREAGVMVMADLDNLYPGVEALLEHVDFLISSREFPERLLGIADPLESLPEIVRRFGCRVAGVTLGQEGALAWDGERSTTARRSGRRRRHDRRRRHFPCRLCILPTRWPSAGG